MFSLRKLRIIIHLSDCTLPSPRRLDPAEQHSVPTPAASQDAATDDLHLSILVQEAEGDHNVVPEPLHEVSCE